MSSLQILILEPGSCQAPSGWIPGREAEPPGQVGPLGGPAHSSGESGIRQSAQQRTKLTKAGVDQGPQPSVRGSVYITPRKAWLATGGSAGSNSASLLGPGHSQPLCSSQTPQGRMARVVPAHLLQNQVAPASEGATKEEPAASPAEFDFKFTALLVAFPAAVGSSS